MAGNKVLAVDDEAFNLDILGEYLTDAGYEVIPARDGQEALDKLKASPDIAVIVLDRMMPGMDGMTCLSQLKADARFCETPVILQTAAASREQICEGIEAGAFYYLTKPYDEAVLLSIVRAAINEAGLKRGLREEAHQQKHVLGLMEQACFHFRTLEEAHNLAVYIAGCFPDPEAVVYGLSELLINAVEHGNLGISYEDKTRLVLAGEWQSAVETRLNDPVYGGRMARLNFSAQPDGISVHIVDQGKGFDYKNYLDFSPERATDPNGRGIATARMMSFDEIDYLGAGNEVVCRVRLTPNA